MIDIASDLAGSRAKSRLKIKISGNKRQLGRVLVKDLRTYRNKTWGLERFEVIDFGASRIFCENYQNMNLES